MFARFGKFPAREVDSTADRMAAVSGRCGKLLMARKLKTYQTSLGFFDLAIAAPSMKAALEAWGADSNLFSRASTSAWMTAARFACSCSALSNAACALSTAC